MPFWFHMWLDFSLFRSFYIQLLFSLPPLIIGLQFFGKNAYHSLKDKNPNMDVLVSLGVVAAVIYSFFLFFFHNHSSGLHVHYFFETAVTIISLVLLGNLIEANALAKTSIQMQDAASLLPIKALKKQVKTDEEKVWIEVDATSLHIHDEVKVTEGQKIPTDGIITNGEIEINESSLTGESVPVFKKTGDTVYAGSIIVSGNIEMRVIQTGSNTLVGQLHKWIKSAQASKPSIQKMGDKVSGVFVQVVVGLSLLTFVISFWTGISLEESILRSIAVLVVSCPCAMGLATPTAVSVGLGIAAKKGILVKGGAALEKLAKATILGLDKTGTITTGSFEVQNLQIIKGDKDEIKNLIWHLESHSSHPIAQSITQRYANWQKGTSPLKSCSEKKGYGLLAESISGDSIKMGSFRLKTQEETLPDADLYLWINDELVATITIKDEPVPHLADILTYFKEQKFTLHLISGDGNKKVASLSQHYPFDKVYSEVLPTEKMAYLKEWQKKGITVMTGDGINDSLALAAADVAVVVGHGSDISKQQADFILLGGGLTKLKEAHKLSKITLGGIKQNLFWAFAYNVVAIPVAAMGYLNPTWAALFMAMSDVVVIGNALRLKWRYA